MSFWGKIKAKTRTVKHASRKADEQATDELWRKSYARFITPSRLEVFDTHLLIDQRTYVRCLVAGLEGPNGEGYPRDMTSKAIERIQELSFEGCKIMLSHGLIQIAGDKAKENLQTASYNVTKEQVHNKTGHKGTDLELMCKEQDIIANYKQIYFNSQKSFYSSFIIVIMGGEKEVFTAESFIISILNSEPIEVQIPAGKQLEVFISALAFPESESKAWVKVRSDTAAVLCTSTNLNSKTDEKGLYFGKDLKTNNEILIDLDTLPAKHFTFLGATGSGKTYSLMLLLMRMHDMMNCRVIYLTPKADKGTNYKAVAKYYGDKACVADLGDTGANINPLQILVDKQTMGDNPYAYAKAYDRHKDLFIKAVKVWLPSLTENADSYLDETLNFVYEQAGIIREQPGTWDRPWPVMQNLYNQACKDAENPDLGTKQKTAEAIKNKMYQITGKGILSYMNRPTTDLDLSKDFIVIDMSNIPEIIKEFTNVLVTGMLHSRFSPDNDRDTIIAIDEAGVFLRNPNLSTDMLVTLTQGRSHGVYLGLCTHQPSDFTKNNMREEYQTNMFCNIILGANIKNAIDDVGKYFMLSEDEKNTLLECGDDEGATPGQGLLIVKGQKIPLKFEASQLEHEVIKGKFLTENPSTEGEFMVLPEYKWLIDDQRIIFSDWCQGDASTLLIQGYERHKVARIAESGTTTAYVPAGMVKDGLIDLPHFGKQTLDHYASVIQLAGLLSVNGFEEISIIHDAEVDISAKIGGLRVAFEYEKYDHKAPEIWMKKKAAALEKYDMVKFVCSAVDAKQIVKVVGENYILRRGAAVSEFIKTLTGNVEIQENEMDSGEYETNEAI